MLHAVAAEVQAPQLVQVGDGLPLHATDAVVAHVEPLEAWQVEHRLGRQRVQLVEGQVHLLQLPTMKTVSYLLLHIRVKKKLPTFLPDSDKIA